MTATMPMISLFLYQVVQYPKNKRKPLPPEYTRPSPYPVTVLRGQYTSYHRQWVELYTAQNVTCLNRGHVWLTIRPNKYFLDFFSSFSTTIAKVTVIDHDQQGQFPLYILSVWQKSVNFKTLNIWVYFWGHKPQNFVTCGWLNTTLMGNINIPQTGRQFSLEFWILLVEYIWPTLILYIFSSCSMVNYINVFRAVYDLILWVQRVVVKRCPRNILDPMIYLM